MASKWVHPGLNDPTKVVAECWRCHTKYTGAKADPSFPCTGYLDAPPGAAVAGKVPCLATVQVQAT